ncbi:RNA ligase family protein [Enhygromyxa salina]|nr:RNA ligase family protein [Enhygromyxa salina]
MLIPDYPRTLHLGDSGAGNSKHHCQFSEVAGHHLVVEEKVDGSHCGLFFDEQAELRVFTRNTVLEHPPRRHDFRLLDRLAHEQVNGLWEVLGDRYVLYGEWAHVTHSIYYDALPGFFLEDDIFDRERGRFLSTPRRAVLVARLPPGFCESVVVLHEGSVGAIEELHSLVGASNYKSSSWRERCSDLRAVEDSEEMEGLYIKQEDPDFVLRRLKWVRRGFLDFIVSEARASDRRGE